MNIQEIIEKVMAPLKRKVSSMILRGVVTSLKDKKLQMVQLSALADETIDNLEYIEPYGYTSVPENGAEAVALFIGGNRDHGVVISVADRRYRPTGLASGDVCLYRKAGVKVTLKASGKISITNPAGNELLEVLSTTLQHLIDAKTMDPLSGPEPLMPDTVAAFTADKVKIDSFKV